MLELYHNNMSVCAQKVRLVLAEKGLEAVEHHFNLRAGEQHSPEHLALNPKGYVPTLVHDGAPVTESTVICEYLDEVFPEPPLRPAEPLARARMRTWTRRPDAGLHEACGTVSSGIAFRHQWAARPPAEFEETQRRTPDPLRRAHRREMVELGTEAPCFRQAVWVYESHLADMEEALSGGGPWLMGEDYTLADVAMTPYVNRLSALKLEGMWAARPRVADWYARITQRPNFIKAIAGYNDPNYLSLMAEQGARHWPAIEAALAEV